MLKAQDSIPASSVTINIRFRFTLDLSRNSEFFKNHLLCFLSSPKKIIRYQSFSFNFHFKLLFSILDGRKKKNREKKKKRERDLVISSVDFLFHFNFVLILIAMVMIDDYDCGSIGYSLPSLFNLYIAFFYCVMQFLLTSVLILFKILYLLFTTKETMSSRNSRTIYVGNLPGDIRLREVEDLFYKVWFPQIIIYCIHSFSWNFSSW